MSMTRATAKRVSRRHLGRPDITLAAIRKFAQRIGERFAPDRIILFGSFAYGEPHDDSDVDLLVVIPCKNEISQAIRIRMALDAPFPMDLIVRTPSRLEQRIRDGDWFLREVVEKGIVLYAKADTRMAAEGSGRPARRT